MGKRLYINNTLVDLGEEVAIPLNKQIADIRFPENRSSSYTKTIVVPGTKSNNKLFGFIFDVAQSVINESDTVNFFPDFNPNLKAACRIYEDTALQIEGYAQLLQINLTGQNEIEYEIAVFGELANLFLSIGSGKLEDLDLSQYNHGLTIQNIKNSWDTSIVVNGVSGSPFAYGKGYVYPAIDYGVNDTPDIQKAIYMRPAIYAKTVIDAIFAEAGFTYTSDSYFNSSFFKRLIIPYSGTDITTTLDRDFRILTDTGAYSIAIGSIYKFPLAQGTGATQYNSGTGEITIATGNGGVYNFYGTWTVRLNDMTAVPGIAYQFYLSLEKNGTEIFKSYTIAPGGAGSSTRPTQYDTGAVTIADGDVLRWRLVSVFDGTTTYTSGHNIDFFASMNIAAPSDYINLGGTVYMNRILPKEILQKDFLVSITRMFNLYWDNTDLANELYIQPRDTYLTDNINDYSRKLDISKQVQILPMGELDANPYQFTYKQDTDYYNDIYFKEFNRVYGDLNYYINNDFIKEPKKTEVIFSPTPLVNDPAWNTDMVLSSFRSYDEKGNIVYKGGNIRILYYGGLQ